MNNRYLISFMILVFLFTWNSCTNKQSDYLEPNESISEGNSVYKGSLESLDYRLTIVNEDSIIVSDFTSTWVYDSILSTTRVIPDLDSCVKQKFDTINIEILHIPLFDNDSVTSSIYAIYVPDSNAFSEAYIFSEIDVDTANYIKLHYANGEEAVSIGVNNNGSIFSVANNGNPVFEPPGGLDCVHQCVVAAMQACFADPECAIMCGICFNYCLGATTIACCFHCNNSNAPIGSTE